MAYSKPLELTRWIGKGRVEASRRGPRLRQGRQWVDLTQGTHRLTFAVEGNRAEVEFSREFRVDPGAVLIAGCRTTFARRPGSPNRRPNRWFIGFAR